MTGFFVGVAAVLGPSALVLAWLVWRSPELSYDGDTDDVSAA